MVDADVASPAPQRKLERFPGSGGKPFSDAPEHQLVFRGRGTDTERLLHLVLSARLTVLYGVSGLGKTSLLQAGVFPRLREESYLPVLVRVAETSLPAALVIDLVRAAAAAAGVELEGGDETGLWEFFRTTTLWRGGTLVTPILVFDQFEEIFGLEPATRSAFAAEIGALASNLAPPRVRERGSAAARGGTELKVVLCLREEDFGALQELSADIPGLFQERVRLAPLSREQAAEAIREPAALESAGAASDAPFESPPFQLAPDALDDLLGFLEGDSHEIQSWEVQQVCSHLEKNLVARPTAPGAPIVVGREELRASGSLNTVLEDFYKGALADIHPPAERRRARVLCEQGLLAANGRRIMLEASQIRSEWDVSQETLDALDAKHVIRHVRRLGGVHYELTHDRLADAIARIRPRRVPKRYLLAVRVAIVAAIVVGGAVAWRAWSVARERAAAERSRGEAESLVGFLVHDEFLEKLRPLATIELLNLVQQRVDGFLGRSAVDERDRIEALAHANAGNLRKEQGKLAEAEREYAAAIRSYDALATAGDDDEVILERSRARCSLAEVLHDRGALAEARRVYEQAVEDARRVYTRVGPAGDVAGTTGLAAGEDARAAALALAHAKAGLGQVLLEQGEPLLAAEAYDALLDAIEPLHRSDDWEVLQSIYAGLEGKRKAYGLAGRDGEVVDLFVRTLPVAFQILRSPPFAPDARLQNARLLLRLADVLSSYPEGVSFADTALSRVSGDLDELARADPVRVVRQRHRAVGRMLRAAYLLGDSRSQPPARAASTIARATRMLDGARTKMEELARLDPANASWQEDLAAIAEQQARALSLAGARDAALAQHRFAAKLLEEVAARDASNTEARVRLASVREKLCDEEAPGDARLAECTAARVMFADLLAGHPAAALWEARLTSASWHESAALRAAGRAEQAATAQRDADAVVRAARERNPLAGVLAALKDLHAAESAVPAARLRAHERAAAALRDAAAAGCSDPWVHSKLSRVLTRIADLRSNGTADGKRAALAACVEAGESAARAVALAPTNAAYHTDLGRANQCRARAEPDAAAASSAREAAIVAATQACDREPYEDELWKAMIGYRLAQADALARAGGPAADQEYRALLVEADRAVSLNPDDFERRRLAYETHHYVAKRLWARDREAARRELVTASRSAHDAESLDGLDAKDWQRLRDDTEAIDRDLRKLETAVEI